MAKYIIWFDWIDWLNSKVLTIDIVIKLLSDYVYQAHKFDALI